MSAPWSKKHELTWAMKQALRDYLQSARGKQYFGVSEVYVTEKSSHTLVLKDESGEYYYVKIQRSPWRADGSKI